MEKWSLKIHRLGISKSTNGFSWQTHLKKFRIKSLYLSDEFSGSEVFSVVWNQRTVSRGLFLFIQTFRNLVVGGCMWIILILPMRLNSSMIFYVYKSFICVPCLWYCSGTARLRVEKELRAMLGLLSVPLDLSTQPWENRQSIWGLSSLQKWMLKDDVTRVLPWLFLQLFSFVCVTTTPPPPPPNLQCSCIIGLERSLTCAI